MGEYVYSRFCVNLRFSVFVIVSGLLVMFFCSIFFFCVACGIVYSKNWW